jgi:large subunit ribosomal protein L15
VKLHDLKPAPGSRTARRRVGRGIAAGQGKTAGRGTKGQKARAGGKIPAWFEGGQTPLHQRIPKLRGFKNPFKIEFEVVNIGDIARLVELGELESGDMPGAKPSKKGAAPITVNQEILRAAGLVRRLDRPMKVLGGGELSTALFVVADAFSASARSKIEGAGGTVSVLEVPAKKRKALGVTDQAPAGEAPEGETPAEASPEAPTEAPTEASTEAVAAAPADAAPAEAADRPARAKRGTARPAADDVVADATADAAPADVGPVAEAPVAEAPAPDAGAPAAADEAAPAKPRASRKPKTPKPDADA